MKTTVSGASRRGARRRRPLLGYNLAHGGAAGTHSNMARSKQGTRPRKNARDRTPLDVGAADNITLVRYARLGVRTSPPRIRKPEKKKRH